MAEQVESKAMEVKEHFGVERALILTELFNLTAHAANKAAQVVSNTLSSNVNRDARQSVFMSEGEAIARDLREDAKTRYVNSELQEQAALEEVEREAREILTPSAIDAAALISASSLSGEQIIDAADSVANAGDAAADTLLTLLSISMQKDYDQAMHHIASLNPEWERAVLDLGICADNPSVDEDDIEARFETLAKGTPDGPAILSAGMNDFEISSLLRG